MSSLILVFFIFRYRLLDTMGLGEDHGGFSPFDIRFIYTQDDDIVQGFEPFDPKAVACYEAISVSPLCSLSIYNFT